MKVPWTFFRLPFCSCLCDARHRLCLFCNILLSLKYKKIMHAIMHSKLKEPVADKVWRQHFHQRENFINKHKNPFSFNNITDLWNIRIKLFSPCLNIYISFTLDLEYFFELNFPVFITDCTMGNITVFTLHKLHFFQMKLNWRICSQHAHKGLQLLGIIQSVDQTRTRPSNPLETNIGYPSNFLVYRPDPCVLYWLLIHT